MLREVSLLDFSAKTIRCTYCVGILCIEDSRFSTKNEVIALGSQSNCHATTEKNESENIAILSFPGECMSLSREM